MARMKEPKKASIETVLKAVNSLGRVVASVGERMATKEDLRNYATKNDVETIVEKAKEEILAVVRPIEKAVDKDAVTAVAHEKRIVKIERQLAIK